MKLLQYLCIPFLLVLTGCAGCGDDDPLSISKQDYYGNELNINGYYYYTFNKFANTEKLSDFYFLYRNGVILYAGAYSLDDIEKVESNFRSETWSSSFKEGKTWWGLYTIQGNQIQFERWYPSERPYNAYRNIGEILNDSTFIIKESHPVDDSNDKTTENEVYHFKKFSPKPDSTNPFVVIF